MTSLASVRYSLLLLPTFALAACATNGELRSVRDAFNGDQQGFALYLDSGHWTAVGVQKAKDKYTLEVLVVQSGVAAFEGKPGDKGQFAVGGEILEFETTVEAKPVATVNAYNVATQWKVTFEIPYKQALRFAQASLTDVKVWVGKETFQMKLEPSDAATFQNNLKIMTKDVPAPSPAAAEAGTSKI